MEQQGSKYSRAGGFIMAVSILVGAIAGMRLGQASIGFLAGAAIGIAIAGALYLYDRRGGA